MTTRPITIGMFSCLAGLPLAIGQQPPDPDYVRQQIYPSYTAFRHDLDRIAAINDPTQRTAELDTFWQGLTAAGQVPYAQGNRVAFLYRGPGSTISWPGDFNGWNPNAAGWSGSQVAGTDVFILEKAIPADARLDYKVFRNGSWLLDPSNPLQIWSGFGPNSELRMPAYEFPRETIRRDNIPHGTLGPNIRLSSTNLGYDIQYRVYTPPGYDSDELAALPVVYVTDGHEYAVDYLGATVNVIDNLIADGKLRNTIAVFIDPRDPGNLGVNRRASQYISNPDFADFVAEELVPAIDSAFRTSPSADDRTILGTSLGGLNSAYFGAVETGTFHNIAIQSPAFSVDNDIYDLYANASLADTLRIFMTNGLINDGSGASRMVPILDQYGYDYRYTTVNEGHSWGNWRGQLDDILTYLVGAPVPEPSRLILWIGGLLGMLPVCRRSVKSPVTRKTCVARRTGKMSID